MTERAKIAAKRRYQKEAEEICPTCQGSGRVLNENAKAKAKANARKGGNVAYLKSLEPGALSMAERGRKGGAPKLPTIEDLMSRKAQRAQAKE